jgi:hypothetical protein
VVFCGSVVAALVGASLSRRLPSEPMAAGDEPPDAANASVAESVVAAVVDEASGRQGI